MVRVLQHLGHHDAWHEKGISTATARRLDPDGHVDGDVEEKAKKPMGKEHGALAGRGVGNRLQHAAETLEQQEGPYYLLLGTDVLDLQLPCPEQRAEY